MKWQPLGFYMLWVLTVLRSACAETIPPAIHLWNIPDALNESSARENKLRAELQTLPNLNETMQFDAYGYHGGYLPALDELPDEPRWTLDFTFHKWVQITEVILVPAIDHRFGRLGSYGFPRRFRILSVSDDGTATPIREWMDTDCPDPGRYPLIVSDVPEPWGHQIRIEVFRGAQDGGREFFALDELIGIFGRLNHNCIGVEASSNYESLPYWGKQFLIDQKTSLGLPLGGGGGERPVGEKDFSVVFDAPPADGCTVELDMGFNRALGWVTVFPAQPPTGIMIPGYGFPGEIHMEIIKETASGEYGRPRRIPEKWGALNPGNNVIHFPGSETTGRWIRIHADKLPLHNGRPTFAIGEIHIHRREITYPIQSIRLDGFPKTAAVDAYRMGDGQAGGQPVMFLYRWLHEIDRRKQVTRSLAELTGSRVAMQLRWKRFLQMSGLSAAGLLALLAATAAVIAVVQRKKALRNLKWRITRDLHDEVGSSLGSISLTAERLESDVQTQDVKEDLADLSLLAREASASLRDVVWMIDQSNILLPALLQKLVSRAERVLSGVELTIDVSSSFPNQVVPLSFKRHLVMLFKEVVHNCARHSGATKVAVSIQSKNEQLILRVRDNGCGFDPAAVTDGWGLDSMKKRGRELGGRVTLQSALGEGTCVELTVPFAAIFAKSDHQYKTSN